MYCGCKRREEAWRREGSSIQSKKSTSQLIQQAFSGRGEEGGGRGGAVFFFPSIDIDLQKTVKKMVGAAETL
jgi:hypothetical protein